MNLKRIYEMWDSWLAKRLLALSEHRLYEGINLHYYLLHEEDKEDKVVFFETASKALNLIKTSDLRRYQRVKDYLPNIAYLNLGIDHYKSGVQTFFVSRFDPRDVEGLACAIVHEATHGYLHAKGIPYTVENRKQHEKICVEEQLRFMRKIIFANPSLSPEEKDEILRNLARQYKIALSVRWWDRKNMRDLQISRLKELLFKKKTETRTPSVCGKLFSVRGDVMDIREGPYKLYYEDGVLKEEGFVKNGALHGEIRTYCPSGGLAGVVNFDGGLSQGEFKEFYKNGNLEIVGFFRDCEPHGSWKFYRKDGSLEIESNFFCGMMRGVSNFSTKGALEFEVNYRCGIKGEWNSVKWANRWVKSLLKNPAKFDATATFYNENGTLKKELVYEGGKLVAEKNFDKQGDI